MGCYNSNLFLYSNLNRERNPDKEPTGVAVNTDDPKDLARGLKSALEDKELLKIIIPNAQKMAREKYDWNLIAHDMKTKVFDVVFAE